MEQGSEVGWSRDLKWMEQGSEVGLKTEVKGWSLRSGHMIPTEVYLPLPPISREISTFLLSKEWPHLNTNKPDTFERSSCSEHNVVS